MRSRLSSILFAPLLLAAAGLSACTPREHDEERYRGGTSAGVEAGPDGSTSTSAPRDDHALRSGLAPAQASATPQATSSANEEIVPLQILKLVFTSNVKGKEPADKLDTAKPGQRVYAHITFRNRSGSSREVDLVFRVNGSERSRVPLEVQSSWSFRTWGYVTLRASDTSGEVTVTVVDDSGEELRSTRLPIGS